MPMVHTRREVGGMGAVMNQISYTQIKAGRTDYQGGLHLTRQKFGKPEVYHPAGEWLSFTLTPDGRATVQLADGD